jgi:hypothetical protein
MKITLTLTKQEAIEALLQFYEGTGASDAIILCEKVETRDDWVSNVGRDSYGHPESLDPNTEIEVKFRNGTIEVGKAEYWWLKWKETEGTRYDIVAYQIL